MTDRGWSPTSMPRRESEHSYGYPVVRSDRQTESASSRGGRVLNARRETAEQASISVRPEDSEQ